MCRAHDKRPFYVQHMQIEEAPLCTDGDPMPESACGGEGREGGEESVGEGKGEAGGVSLALSAITVSGGGRGTEKLNQAILVLSGSYIREEGP